MSGLERDELLNWWIRCPECEKTGHSRDINIVDIGFEDAKPGNHVFWTCDRCLSKIEKTVGKDLGRVLVKGSSQDHIWDVGALSYATTWCDRCDRTVTIHSTFLFCTECRKKYVHLLIWLATAGLVKYCFMCGRILALDADWCDRCGRNQYL